MNVGELREFVASLDDMPDDTLVLLSSDEEGNSYRPADVERAHYVEELNRWTDRDGTTRQTVSYECVADVDIGIEYAVDDVHACVLLW